MPHRPWAGCVGLLALTTTAIADTSPPGGDPTFFFAGCHWSWNGAFVMVGDPNRDDFILRYEPAFPQFRGIEFRRQQRQQTPLEGLADTIDVSIDYRNERARSVRFDFKEGALSGEKGWVLFDRNTNESAFFLGVPPSALHRSCESKVEQALGALEEDG